MAKKLTADNLFKPRLSRGESKALATEQAYRSIVKAEVEARNMKTERLRKARLKQAKNPVRAVSKHRRPSPARSKAPQVRA